MDATATDNPLDRWRKAQGLTIRAVSYRLDVPEKTARRYFLPLNHPDFRQPRGWRMRAVLDVTGGAVRSDDLLPVARERATASANARPALMAGTGAADHQPLNPKGPAS